MQLSKHQIRHQYRLLRSEIAPDVALKAAEFVAQRLADLAIFTKSEKIASYLPMPGEFITHPMHDLIWQAGKACYLPKLIVNSRALSFAKYDKDKPLLANRLQVLEPDSNAAICALAELDLILLPLVAFDREGHRLGMGGGFYDMTLAQLADNTKKPFLLGVGFAQQEYAPGLPNEKWDKALDAILTEKEVIFCNKRC